MTPKLLVADDDFDTRQAMKFLIETELGADFEVVEAEDGEQAIVMIRKLTKEELLCVSSDFDMPFNNGIEVANAALDASVQNVVLMTGRAKIDLIDRFGQQRVDDLLGRGLKLLRKPSSLSEIIRNVIDPIRKAS